MCRGCRAGRFHLFLRRTGPMLLHFSSCQLELRDHDGAALLLLLQARVGTRGSKQSRMRPAGR